MQDDEAGEGGHGQGPLRGSGEAQAPDEGAEGCLAAAEAGHDRLHRSHGQVSYIVLHITVYLKATSIIVIGHCV